MNVVTLEPPSMFNVANARNAAADLEKALIFLRAKTDDAVDGVRKAKTIDKIVLRYAAWLGHWHRCAVANTYAMHFRGALFRDGRILVAASQIKNEIASINASIERPAIWIAVPNVGATRFNITNLLTNANASMDIALAECAVLEGHNLTEGKSA